MPCLRHKLGTGRAARGKLQAAGGGVGIYAHERSYIRTRFSAGFLVYAFATRFRRDTARLIRRSSAAFVSEYSVAEM
jgi:hypothetical protein